MDLSITNPCSYFLHIFTIKCKMKLTKIDSAHTMYSVYVIKVLFTKLKNAIVYISISLVGHGISMYIFIQYTTRNFEQINYLGKLHL